MTEKENYRIDESIIKCELDNLLNKQNINDTWYEDGDWNDPSLHSCKNREKNIFKLF